MIKALHTAVRMEGVLTDTAYETITLEPAKGPRRAVHNTKSFVGSNFSEGYEAYRQFLGLASRDLPLGPRDMFEFAPNGKPLSIDEVEPLEAIFMRFSTAAMSHGALSSESHETLAVAMNRLGAMSNSGEGGSAKHRLGTERNDRTKQVASGRFGVTPAYLMSADEIQIKNGARGQAR